MPPPLSGLLPLRCAVVACALILGYVPARAADIEPEAERILRSMGDSLEQGSRFTFRVDELYDAALELGSIVQMRAVARIAVRRPDRLRVRAQGDAIDREIRYDGRKFSLLDLTRGQYAMAEIAATTDGAIDHLAKEYGFTITLADIVYPDVYKVLIENVQKGFYLGRRSVRDVPAHHLLFVQADIDWQIWVADAALAVPLKVVLTFKKEPGSPRLLAWFSDWDFSPPLPDSAFEFSPPSWAERVDFREMAGRDLRPRKE